MKASLTESLRVQAPWGLLGMLALVLTVEQAGIANNPTFQSMHAASWSYAGKAALKKVSGREILCFGDSQVKFGVLPPVLKARTGKSAFNLAVPVGPAPTSYFLLRRVLESGAHPSAVIVDFNSGIQKEGPNSQILAYPWGDLLSVREAFDLAWTARDPELFGRIVLASLVPSCKTRYEIRAHLLACLRGQREDNSVSLLVSRLNWNRNDGAQAHFKTPFNDVPPPPAGPRQAGRWECDPVNAQYIHRFLKLAGEHHVQVYWLLAPLCPMAQAHLEFRGDDDRFRTFVEKTRSSFPEVVVIDGRRPGLDRTFFFDDRHLDRDGASALSSGIGEIITRRQAGKGDPSRWLELSHVEEQPVAIAVEDVGKSLLDLRSFSARRRR